MPRLDILVVGHNYAPEPVGIGPCTAGLAEMLATAGHRVRVICGTPSYPQWRIAPGYARFRSRRTVENGVAVHRLPHFVPSVPHGWGRIMHHLSFGLLAIGALLSALAARRPDVILAVTPSIVTGFLARLYALAINRPIWVHVQDFETEMALATGQLRGGAVARRLAQAMERVTFGAHRVSSISPAMCRGLVRKGVAPHRIAEFRNWARPDVVPLRVPSPYRAEWAVTRPRVALYAGNIGAKQGLQIIVEAARLLAHRTDLLFVICGEGPARRHLAAMAAGCDNLLFRDLQPAERLGDLLGLADVHLLPQIAGAADLVLPSKLPNMLASGRPVIVTAAPGTGLADEVAGCGLVTPPGDATAFAHAILTLVDDPARCASLGRAAEAQAAMHWNKDVILADVERALRMLVVEWRAGRTRRPSDEPVAGTLAK